MPESQETPTSSERPLMTVTEVADFIGLSKSFTYELCHQGKIPVIRFGRRILVPRKPLLALLEEMPS